MPAIARRPTSLRDQAAQRHRQAEAERGRDAHRRPSRCRAVRRGKVSKMIELAAGCVAAFADPDAEARDRKQA